MGGICFFKGTATVDRAEALAARIDKIGYLTVDEGFAAVKEGETLEILKAGDYALPETLANITIKGDVDGVVFSHTTAGNVSTVSNGITFKNLTFNFGNVNYHGFQHAGTIAMNGCTINGKPVEVGYDPRESLLDTLRDRLHVLVDKRLRGELSKCEGCKLCGPPLTPP